MGIQCSLCCDRWLLNAVAYGTVVRVLCYCLLGLLDSSIGCQCYYGDSLEWLCKQNWYKQSYKLPSPSLYGAVCASYAGSRHLVRSLLLQKGWSLEVFKRKNSATRCMYVCYWAFMNGRTSKPTEVTDGPFQQFEWSAGDLERP